MATPRAELEDRLAKLTASDPDARVVAQVLDSPVGLLVAAAVDDGLAMLEFGTELRLPPQVTALIRHFGPVRVGPHPLIEQTAGELEQYFAGTRQAFDVPLALRGTPFQELVWRALLEIPYGDSCSYSDLARRLERPGGQRAVGLANGQNRLAIIVPCHRVLEQGGGLRGYGGGLDRKRFLLDLERRHVDPLAGTPLGRAIAG